MKKTIGIILAMLISMAGLAIAGSLDADFDDCTRQDEVCVEQHCDSWHYYPYPHCHHYTCDEWQEVCEDSIPNSIHFEGEIDADSLEGESAADIKGYSDAHDDVGGGGIGTWELAELLGWPEDYPSKVNNFMLYLKKAFMPRNELQDELDLLQAQINLLQADQPLTKESIVREMGEIQRVRDENGDSKYLCYPFSTTGCIEVW